MLNAFDKLEATFKESKFIINKDFDYKILKEESLTNRIVFAFDQNANLGIEQYKELIELCANREIYILFVTKEEININLPNVKIINFYDELISNPNYLMIDKIHLSEFGNVALNEILQENLIQQTS